jgi:hypothetical protein
MNWRETWLTTRRADSRARNPTPRWRKRAIRHLAGRRTAPLLGAGDASYDSPPERVLAALRAAAAPAVPSGAPDAGTAALLLVFKMLRQSATNCASG